MHQSEMTRPGEKGEAVRRLGFLSIPIVVAVAAHLEFSWMGYTPTDDGWVLAGSRRILAGQIPHRDFLALQPAGSEFLHLPEVAFGGDHTYWISRLIVWLQFAVIAWAWPEILAKLTNSKPSRLQSIALGFLCFLFTSSTLFLTPWPTIDGLFLVSVGLLLCLRTGSLSKSLGYFLIGFSYVCKQNFVVVFPAALILLGDWKRIRYWATAIFPVFIYVGFLSVFGAVPHALAQIAAQRSIIEHGIKPYLMSKQVLAAAAVGLGYAKLLLRKGSRTQDLGICLGYLIILCSALTLSAELYWFASHTAFVLFGFVLGATLGLLARFGASRETATAGMLVLIVTWAMSISMGFNYPILGCGLLVLFLLQAPLATTGRWFSYPRLSLIGMAALLIVSLVSYGVGRSQHIYRDRAASQLTAKLDGVLPGGGLLRTNPNTYEFLADLRLATKEVRGSQYAVVPGIPGYWVKADQLNPLLMDWPLAEAMPNPKMVDRLIENLAAQKGKIVLIVEKVEPTTLKKGFFPLSESLYPPAFLSYVRENFQKVGETRFFELRR